MCPEAPNRISKLKKAKAADRPQGVQEGEVGTVDAKVVGMGPIRGIMSGNFGEISKDTHLLVAAGHGQQPAAGGRAHSAAVGTMRGREAERSAAVTVIRHGLGVVAVSC